MSSTTPITKRYYPKLSELITVDDLPDFLDFAKDGLDSLLGSVHYKNFQFSKSARGDSAFYSLDIVSKNIGFDLPFGLQFVLNPDVNGDTTISSFPISLQYQWEVLAFLRSFNLANFAFTPDAFFQLGLQIFKVTDEQVLANTLNFFVGSGNIDVSKYQQLLDDINTLYPSANLTLPSGQTPTVNLVAQLIKQNVNIPKSISELMFAIYIFDNGLDAAEQKLQQFFNIIVPGGIEDYVQKLIKPKAKASLMLSAGIEFPTTILQPVTSAGVVIPNQQSVFQFIEATFYVDTESGIGSQIELGGSLIPTYAEIGNTGLIISFTNAKLDLSTTTNIPEADAAGYPVDFVGIYVQQASVSLNKFGTDDTEHVSASITANNLFIGTGGISGTIKLQDNGLLHRQFGAFYMELDTFAITFRMGAITSAAISGKLQLPNIFNSGGNPITVLVTASINDKGGFSFSAKIQTDYPPITLPGVFRLNIRTLEVGDKDGRFYLQLSGKLDFIADIPGLGAVLPKGIDIAKLLIWDNGDLEFVGGSITVHKSFRLKVGPVSLEVSQLTLGSYQRKLNGVDRNYYFFGFDGMLNAGNSGVEVGGNGIKYYFTHDNNDTDKPFDNFLSIDGIEVDIKVPNDAPANEASFILKGFLSMKNPDPAITGSTASTEYTGKVSFSLPKLGIAGSAAMRLKPSVPSYLVDIGVEFPTAIPLGGTGLGIYAFRGLIGEHFVPAKSATNPPLPDTATWWDYYKAKSTLTHQEGIEIDKFADKPGFSIGAGVSLATDLADSGYILSAKLFLLLGLPDVFLIQGQASILTHRLGLNENVDPPFSALIIFGDQSIQGDLGVDFNLPDSGSIKGIIMSLQANLEMAFFFNNISGWYLNIGKDTPATAQVRAKLLTLFQGHAYLMISTQGVKVGAGISFDFNKSFGPVGVGLGAFLNLGGFISFKPIQVGGFIQVGGYAYLKVWKFKFGLSIAISLAVEAPNPFNIVGSLQVKLDLPWPLPDIKFTLDMSWRFNTNQQVLLDPIPVLSLPDPTNGYTPAAATNILTNEVFTINYVNEENVTSIPVPGDSNWKYNFTDESDVENVIIPLDSFIDIELLKPVKPVSTAIGGAANQLPDGFTELVPPKKGVNAQVRHQYELSLVEIYAWNGTAWVPYNIYEAVTAIVDSNTGDNEIDLGTLKAGYWQFTNKNQYNKVRLLSQNMFSYMNGTTSNQEDLDARNFKSKDVFCFENMQENHVINWTNVPDDTVYTADQPVAIELLTFTFSGVSGSVNGHNLLIAGRQGTMTIVFPEPVAYVKLEFGENLNQVSVNFIQTQYTVGQFGEAMPSYPVTSSSTLVPGQTNAVVVYQDSDVAIDRINLVVATTAVQDYEGDLVLGGHFRLPDMYIDAIDADLNGAIEKDKGLMFSTWYNRSFTPAEVLAADYSIGDSVVAQWPLNSPRASAGNQHGILSGSPDMIAGFYQSDSQQQEQLYSVYHYTANNDALIVPYSPVFKIENSSFAFEITAIFDPFSAGISTLFSKLNTDNASGDQKGFTLHLVQSTPADPGTAYTSAGDIPVFSVVLTCYSGLTSSAITITDPYTLDCAASTAKAVQYKRIFVSVDRETGTIELFIDKILKTSTTIPTELSVVEAADYHTYLNQVTYITEVVQARIGDNPITETDLINEVQILSDTINKTIQPIWRPDTTFAVKVATLDRVNNSTSPPVKTRIFGFQTAGPLGHFHQRSKIYQQLAQQDQASAFKLSNLQFYIDYDRSFPDAQGRYNQSKPVLYHNPQVKLYFTQPYINAMYANWDTYQGLAPVQSKLELQLLDPSGAVVTQQLVWNPEQDIPIDSSNFTSLTKDQQTLYLLNQAASVDDLCNPITTTTVKRLRQGSYQFPDIEPNKLYTALFNAVYQPEGSDPDSIEVYKFSFMTSRFATFEEQAGSYILDATPGSERYAIYPQSVSFTQYYIDNTLKVLINDNLSDDPPAVAQYAVKYERLVYGGLKLPAPESFNYSAINLVINTNPADNTDRKVLGIVVYNPEPFNDPKLPAASLSGTIGLTLTLADSTVLDDAQFIYSYSRDNSAVFITNAEMIIPLGQLQLNFRYKLFNGIDYETEYEDYTGAPIDLTPYF